MPSPNALSLLPSTQQAINNRYGAGRPADAGDAITAVIQRIVGGVLQNKQAEVDQKNKFISSVENSTYNELVAAAKAGDAQAQMQLDDLGNKMGMPAINFNAQGKRLREQSIAQEDLKFTRTMTQKQKESDIELANKIEEYKQIEIPKMQAQSANRIAENKSKPPKAGADGTAEIDSTLRALSGLVDSGILDGETAKIEVETLMSRLKAKLNPTNKDTGRAAWIR